MDAAAELGRNPVSKHQYGAMLKGWEKIKNDTTLYSCIDEVHRGKGKKSG